MGNKAACGNFWSVYKYKKFLSLPAVFKGKWKVLNNKTVGKMSVLCLLYYAHSEIVSKNQLHWDLGRGISNFCISRKLKCWTKMCEDLGTSGYVFLVSRKLCIWLTTCLWRLFRAFLYHTLPYRYLQSKSHFTLLSSFFNMAGKHFENFMLYAKSWQEKKKEKKNWMEVERQTN